MPFHSRYSLSLPLSPSLSLNYILSVPQYLVTVDTIRGAMLRANQILEATDRQEGKQALIREMKASVAILEKAIPQRALAC